MSISVWMKKSDSYVVLLLRSFGGRRITPLEVRGTSVPRADAIVEAVTGAAVAPDPKGREPFRVRDRAGDTFPDPVRDDRAARCWLDPSEEIHGQGSGRCPARGLPAGSIAQRSRSRAIACGTKGAVPLFSATSPPQFGVFGHPIQSAAVAREGGWSGRRTCR